MHFPIFETSLITIIFKDPSITNTNIGADALVVPSVKLNSNYRDDLMPAGKFSLDIPEFFFLALSVFYKKAALKFKAFHIQGTRKKMRLHVRHLKLRQIQIKQKEKCVSKFIDFDVQQKRKKKGISV